MRELPVDWPGAGPIDLGVHDLPHKTAQTEWWYVHAHIETADKRRLGLFASFFRIIKGQDPITREVEHAHSLTWAISELDSKRYWGATWVDRDAPRLGLDKLERGEGAKDPRLRRALREMLEKGSVPYPDQLFPGEVIVSERKLDLDFCGDRFSKRDDGAYELELWSAHWKGGAKLVFDPRKGAVRHGEDGVVRGADGADMFYYFIPRCEVTGTVTVEGHPLEVRSGSGWYDHEFGGYTEEVDDKDKRNVAWLWTAAQLDCGTDVTAYALVDGDTGERLDSRAILVGPDGGRAEHTDLTFEPRGMWRSTRTFNEYPTHYRVAVPSAGLELDLAVEFEDQEFVTLITKAAFWEGRVQASGTLGGARVAGHGYVERSGFLTANDLDGFFKSVGREVRRSVQELIPFDMAYEQARDFVASKEREQLMDGVHVPTLVDTMVRPVRSIVDRGGKSWRSYAALACCDIVGGDSRDYVRWLALPEFLHVGSLIVDDVQDRSDTRRGGPTAHLVYGEAIASNAGTACYFMGQRLLSGPKLTRDDRLRLYDLYFEALRAGHAGQALDLAGLDGLAAEVAESGAAEELERRILAIHRLKTAAPAAALARMGGVAGGGTDAQIEALGHFFESLGLAFQIVDDVLNLRGFRGNLKTRGEDLMQGKVTLPVARAFSMLDLDARRWLWTSLRGRPEDRDTIEAMIERIEACGAMESCMDQARSLIEHAWTRLDAAVPDSLP
jgi:geranylgeranyl pyrophosphate synthase/predicted secreted hydrolase